MRKTQLFTWCLGAMLILIAQGNAAHADALLAGTAPTIDGVIAAGEWDFAQTEFDSGPRPYDGSATGWDLSGARGTFAWTATHVYCLMEAYPNTGGLGANPNGPFDEINWEVYANADDWPATYWLHAGAGGVVTGPGATSAFSGDNMVIEFCVPIANMWYTTGSRLFDPTIDFLEYRTRTTDPDAAGGFDTRDQTLGWVIEPPETGGGYRRLDFTSVVIPLPAAAWMGFVMLGGMGGVGAIRRKFRKT